MSIAPEAQEWLRHQAYERWGHMPKAERQASEIAAWCEAQLRRWRDERPDGRDLADGQLRATAKGVARYMVVTYGQRSKRPPAKTTFESRAMRRLGGALMADLIEMDGETPTTTMVARRADISRTTAHRGMAEHRGTPKRNALVAKLRPTEQTLLGLAEALLSRDGECVVRIDDVVARLWPPVDGVVTEPGTVRQRRKRVRDGLAALAPVSFYIVADGALLALRRGRRWTDDDAKARLARALASAGHVASLPAERVGGKFWSSREIRGLVAVLRVTLGDPVTTETFWDFLLFQRVVMDPTPISRVYAVAHKIGRSSSARFPGFIRYILSDQPTYRWRFDPVVRRALYELARRIEHLYETVGRYGGSAESAVHVALVESHYRDRVDADGLARIEAFRAIVGTSDGRGSLDCHEALVLCERLAKEEAAGRWSAEPYLNPDCPF